MEVAITVPSADPTTTTMPRSTARVKRATLPYVILCNKAVTCLKYLVMLTLFASQAMVVRDLMHYTRSDLYRYDAFRWPKWALFEVLFVLLLLQSVAVMLEDVWCELIYLCAHLAALSLHASVFALDPASLQARHLQLFACSLISVYSLFTLCANKMSAR